MTDIHTVGGWCGVLLAISMGLSAMGATAGVVDANERCVRLENRITELQLRLRLGYTTRQGRLYRQKLASLKAERKAAKCR